MSSFIQLSVSLVVSSKLTTQKVEIVKFKKAGTKRIFFAPRVNGLAINTTMYARLSCAKNLAVTYLNHKAKQNETIN